MVVEDMSNQIDEFNKNSSAIVILQKREKDCEQAVKDLQGKLSDLNIILDKAGTDASQEEIQQQYLQLKVIRAGVILIPISKSVHSLLQAKNDVERKRLNSVFTERSTMDQRTKDAETQIETHRKGIESKLNELAPSKRKEYQELQAENSQLQLEKCRLESSLESMNDEIVASKHKIAADSRTSQAFSFTEQQVHLSERKFELEAEENKLKLDPEEQQKELMFQIRQDKAEIAQLEDQASALRTTIQRLNEKLNLSSLDKFDMSSAESMSFPQLQAQEQKLEADTEGLQKDLELAVSRSKAKKKSIVGILESILHSEDNGSGNKLSDLQTELDYKQLQYQNSQQTSAQLHQELEMRREELTKIDTLEEKIEKEVISLNKRIGDFEEEMKHFISGDELRLKSDNLQIELEKSRKHLLGRKDMLALQVDEKKKEFQSKQGDLTALPNFVNFEKEEMKMRKLQQEIFSLEEYVVSKESEIDCAELSGDIIRKSDSVNTMLKKLALL